MGQSLSQISAENNLISAVVGMIHENNPDYANLEIAISLSIGNFVQSWSNQVSPDVMIAALEEILPKLTEFINRLKEASDE